MPGKARTHPGSGAGNVQMGDECVFERADGVGTHHRSAYWLCPAAGRRRRRPLLGHDQQRDVGWVARWADLAERGVVADHDRKTALSNLLIELYLMCKGSRYKSCSLAAHSTS